MLAPTPLSGTRRDVPQQHRKLGTGQATGYGKFVTSTRSGAANGGAKPNWLSTISSRPWAILAVVKVRLAGVGVTETSLPEAQSPSSASSLIWRVKFCTTHSV